MREPVAADREDAVSPEEMVAVLAAEHRSQAEMAQLLNLSQSSVSRLLTAAEGRGYLVREIQLRLPEARAQQVQAVIQPRRRWADLRGRLAEASGDEHLLSVDVVPAPPAEDDPDIDPWEARCLRFGRRAARKVAEYLKQSRLVGVSYGRTLASVVDGLRHLGPTAGGHDRGVRFFPTWTEPYEDANYRFVSKLFPNPADLSSTRLAKAFARALGGPDDDVPSLNCFPSLLPLDDRFDAAELAVIRRFYHSNASYRQVFESPKGGQAGGLVHQMDAAVVGIGTTTPQGPKANPNWHVSKTVVESAGFDATQHERAYLGDIGGVWLKRPPARGQPKRAARASQEYVARIDDRWMGVTYNHLRACAAAAVAHQRVGVVALAVGRERCDAVLESVRSSLVNRLIIDPELAAALGESTDHPRPLVARTG